MKRSGIILSFVLVTAFLGISLSVVYLRFSSLPHPRTASHNQLMYWMVLKDLKRFEPEIHLALVDRFAEEAAEIFEKNNAAQAGLSDSQTRRLRSNIELLKQVWFEDRIATYCDINHPETCETFMRRQIQLLEDFGNIAFEHAAILYPEKSGPDLTTISDELLADIDTWLNQTPAEDKQQTLQAVREATVFWLATQDLSLQVMAARQELVRRVIAELEKGMDLAATTSIVTSERAEQLRKNALLLMEAWVHSLADQFAKIPDNEKPAFVDGKIEKVQSWKLLEYLLPVVGSPDISPKKSNEKEANITPSTAQPSLGGLAKFNQLVESWIDRASEPSKSRIRKLHTAFQQRIFLRMLKSNG